MEEAVDEEVLRAALQERRRVEAANKRAIAHRKKRNTTALRVIAEQKKSLKRTMASKEKELQRRHQDERERTPIRERVTLLSTAAEDRKKKQRTNGIGGGDVMRLGTNLDGLAGSFTAARAAVAAGADDGNDCSYKKELEGEEEDEEEEEEEEEEEGKENGSPHAIQEISSLSSSGFILPLSYP